MSVGENEYVTDETDSRGRLNVGAEKAGKRVNIGYVRGTDVEDLQTKNVDGQGRIHLGPDRAGEKVTVAILGVIDRSE